MIKHYLNIFLLILNWSISYFLFYNTPYFKTFILISFVLYFLIVSCGVLFLKFNYFLKSTNTLKDKQCLLTFDDGPDPINTPIILEILKKHQIKALFFVVGKKCELNPEIVLKIKNEGHLIGNHTYSHNNFLSLLPSRVIQKEINNGNEVIEKIIGEKSIYFRPPIGYTNPNYARVIKNLNIKTIGWSLRSYDTVFKNEQKLIQRLVSKIKSNSIVLLHDNLSISRTILDEFIIQSKNKGINFVQLNQKLEIVHD